MFFKKGVLKNFTNFTGKHLCCKRFLIKLQAWRPKGLQLYQKETPTQLVFNEISKIFKNTFSYGTPPVTASDIWLLVFGYYKFYLKTGNNSKNIRVKILKKALSQF